MPTDKQKSNKGKQKNELAMRQQRGLINLADRTPEERKAIASKGAKAALEVKKEKKFMSQILADYLQEEHEVVLRDDEGNVIDRETIPADKLISRTVTAIMARGDSASASMIKTIGEITEGKNINLAGSLATHDMTPEELDRRIDELEQKRKGK